MLYTQRISADFKERPLNGNTMTLSTSLKRTLEDDSVTDAESTISQAKELDQRVASGTSIDSTGAPVNATSDSLPPPPTRIPLDPEYVRRREESLRATGEILRQKCNAKLERLNQVSTAVVSILPCRLKEVPSFSRLLWIHRNS